MNEAPEIRPAIPADIDHILTIERLCFSDPWPRSVFVSEIAGEAPPFIACTEAGLVGYVCHMWGAQEMDITNIAVHPEHRRLGVARLLMCTCIRVAAGRGGRCIYLDVRPSNRAALALYATLGFEVIHRRRRYYSGPTEDGLVLARPVKPGDTHAVARSDGGRH